MKVGFLGGSFNPAHDGHLYISQKAKELLNLDEIWWSISPHNPLKSENILLDYQLRIDSIQKIIEGTPIKLKEFEKEWETQFMVDTLKSLKNKFPIHKFVLLMGADNFIQLPCWKSWKGIIEMVPIAVLNRETKKGDALSCKTADYLKDYKLDEEKGQDIFNVSCPAWVYLSIKQHPASSTEIRKKKF